MISLAGGPFDGQTLDETPVARSILLPAPLGGLAQYDKRDSLTFGFAGMREDETLEAQIAETAPEGWKRA